MQQKTQEQETKILVLNHQIEQFKRMIFGVKSERFVPTTSPDQLQLDILSQAVSELESAVLEIATEQPRKRKKPVYTNLPPSRAALPENLPRRKIVIEPDQDTTGCKKIGEEITEVLELIEPSLEVIQYIRPKYVLPQGETVIIAELPARVIDKGIAGPKLLAHIIIGKYVDHLPVYRQVNRFKRLGVNLSDSTIYGWQKEVCDSLLVHVYNRLREITLQSAYLMADETTIKVLTDQKKGSTHQGYYWGFHSPLLRLVLFEYQQGRDGEKPRKLLNDFKGYLQSDGYSVYEGFEKNPDITLLGCMTHARRNFDKALDTDNIRAQYVLCQMQKLYEVERQIKEKKLALQDIVELRAELSVPILKQLQKYMTDNICQVLPQSPIGKAMAYALRRWDKLMQYTSNGILQIDNNPIENAIRPIAIGRKNYLFAGSHESAQRAAMIYSLVGCCKMNGINPEKWMAYVLEKIPAAKINDIDQFLPHNCIGRF